MDEGIDEQQTAIQSVKTQIGDLRLKKLSKL